LKDAVLTASSRVTAKGPWRLENLPTKQ